MKICGCSEEVANCFQGRPLGFFGLGSDAVPAAEARDLGYPGFAGLKLPGGANAAWNEPYIYHFPDGNASIARLLVRSLIPGAAPGNTMDDVVLARVRLCRARPRRSAGPHPARFDLRSCRTTGGQGAGRLCARRRAASRRGAPCGAGLLPHDDPAHRAGVACSRSARRLPKNVKTPLCYTNVLVRNWRAFANLKVNSISAPMGFHHQVSLDFPVSLGGYQPSARSVRADAAASRPCARRAEPGARRARAIPHRPGQALCDDLRGFRGAHPRRSRPHARAGRVFQRARHRRDHRQPLAARLQLRGEFAVRSATTTRTRCSRSRGSRSARSPSPTPMPAAMPGCITPSIRPIAR